MTDKELVAKKLAVIETAVAELRSLARPEMLRTDVREERFVEHTLQIAIQAALDVASHVVSDEHLGESPKPTASCSTCSSGPAGSRHPWRRSSETWRAFAT